MSRRSDRRRHARREKMARKWATYGNALKLALAGLFEAALEELEGANQ